MPFFWQTPTWAHWGLMVLLGVIAGGGHLCLIQAYRRAAASMLAPFAYVQLVWATAVGYAIFGDFPDGPTIAGALVIIASGIYVVYRERAVKETAAAAPRRGPDAA